MRLFGSFGYIKIKDGADNTRPVNIRSIMVVEEFNNQFAKNCKARLIFLDRSFMNIQESKEEIESKILKIV